MSASLAVDDALAFTREGEWCCTTCAENALTVLAAEVERLRAADRVVTAASVVDAVRAELLAIPGMTPAARKAVAQVLNRVTGTS